MQTDFSRRAGKRQGKGRRDNGLGLEKFLEVFSPCCRCCNCWQNASLRRQFAQSLQLA
jgi:hypothetical protein